MRFLACAAVFLAAAASAIDVPINTIFSSSEPDVADFLYSSTDPLILGNDGSAPTGGVKAFSLSNPDDVNAIWDKQTGRSKLVASAYGVAGKDWVVTLSQEDSILRLISPDGKDVRELRKIWGDYNALCSWRKNGRQYLYIFGKKNGKMLALKEDGKKPAVVEVSSFLLPIEAEACAVDPVAETVYFGGADKTVYSFPAEETAAAPKVKTVFETEEEVTGLAVYVAESAQYLFVGSEEALEVRSAASLKSLGSITFTGLEDLELKVISLLQSKTSQYPVGAIGIALESDDMTGLGVASLEPILKAFSINANTAYTPATSSCKSGEKCSLPACPRLDNCSNNGFCSKSGDSCSCFSGYAGRTCDRSICTKNCSKHGICIGNNQCKCKKGWSGPDCSFAVVPALYETEENGGDGDDPAIWIHPTKPEESRIITTTKSEEGAGLAVFDLKGKMLGRIDAEEPNNVDVIYNFPLLNRTVDIAVAGCRGDNTICIYELLSTGLLSPTPLASHPVPEDFEVYGTCTYHSRSTSKFYAFANSKEAQYLQYQITASSDSSVSLELVRTFSSGTLQQPEGCVTDEETGSLYISEEPHGLWRYPAEPDVDQAGVAVDTVDTAGGKLFADVEGVTLVYGPTAEKGFIIVSCQGHNAFNIYRRTEPWELVRRVTVGGSTDGNVDAVTLTDGVAAVGRGLKVKGLEEGVMVVHDDVNRRKGGSVGMASFKIVGLRDVLGDELMKEVDTEWDPRKY